MNNISKKNLLSMLCVFSFVAFCFAIANTFGNTYAADTTETFTFTFDANGGSGSTTKTCTKGDSVTLAGTPTKSGHTFLGWDSEGSRYNAGSSVSCLKDRTFTAAWRSNGSDTTSYIVTFNANGGTVSPSSYTTTSTVTVPTPTRDGYTFKYWTYTNASGTSSVTVNGGETITVTSNMTLTAVWEEIEGDYTVTYNANGGTVSPTFVNVSSGSTITVPTPVKTGHTFKHWAYTTSQGMPRTVSAGGTITVTSDMTLTAIWEAKDKYTVIYNANGGTVSPTSVEVTSGENITVPTPTKTGYTFKHWIYSDSSVQGSKTVSAGGRINVTSDMTLTAVWTANDGTGDGDGNNPGTGGTPGTGGNPGTGENPGTNDDENDKTKYTVTFNANGGKLLVNGQQTNTTTYSLEILDYSDYVSEKENYIFKGWRTSTGSCDDAKADGEIELTKNLSLVACLDEENDEIDENPNTGSSMLYIVYLIGILALGYTGYYSYRYIKSRNK